MKIKRAILLLTVVSLLAIPAMALKEYGDVPPPTDLSYSTDPGDETAEPPTPATITFDWVPGIGKAAEKYSLDICGMVSVDGLMVDVPVEDVEIEWCVSFGTSDWNEDMSASEITIPLEDLHIAIFAAIDEAIADAGITEAEYELEEMYAKVKGLDPSDKNPKKRQNNEFSEQLDLMPHPAP